jgi:acetyl esterase/lipase
MGMLKLTSQGRIWGLVALLAFGVACLAKAQVPPATNATSTNAAAASAPFKVPDSIEAPPEMVFGNAGGVDLHAFIAYPKNSAGLLPAIINIHGGGWTHGSPDERTAVGMAGHGYFGASIEYRLSNVAKWPAQIEDCKLAVRWLRANAAQYHVDPNRIGVFGGSAGGYLVACLATMADQKQYDVGAYPDVSSAAQAVVDFFGPVDFTIPSHYPPNTADLLQRLMGMPFAQNPDAWKSASPVFFVKAGDPPVLIVQGEVDHTVPAAQSIEFDAALAKAGVEHQLIMVKNADHGFRPNPAGSKIDPTNAQINAAVYAFFAKHLKGP